MAKFFGIIGYAETKEVRPGVWEEEFVEREYFGELIKNTRRLQPTDQLNDNINIANEVSIISDPFANDHVYAMRYVIFMGAKWKITNVEIQYPRLILTIGGVYNVQQT